MAAYQMAAKVGGADLASAGSWNNAGSILRQLGRNAVLIAHRIRLFDQRQAACCDT
eukprot:SAG31_NODE_18412_length_637_cov_1.249071_2_plen_55_part_01